MALWAIKILFLTLSLVRAEQVERDPDTAMEKPVRPIAVMPSWDATTLQVGQAVQYTMVQMLQQTQMFEIKLSQQTIADINKNEIAAAFDKHDADLMIVAMVEWERLSIFLFDVFRPKEFILASRPMSDPSGAPYITPQMVEYTLPSVFQEVLEKYENGGYEVLPGEELDIIPEGHGSYGEKKKREKMLESQKLFRELASLEVLPFYTGANIGMSRFSASDSTANTISFGIHGGKRLSSQFGAEVGFDFFAYLMAQTTAKYYIPILNERYVTLAATASAGMILSVLTENLGFTSTNIKTGQPLFGPGLALEIPLLGTFLRGEVKYFVGSGGTSLFFGNYGMSIHL